MKLASRVTGVSESIIFSLNETAQKMKSQGLDVINLTAGEPDFFVPDPVAKAVIDAVHRHQSRYSPVAGMIALRQQIAHKMNQQQPCIARNDPWTAQHVVVTHGAKQALFNIFLSILDPQDQVLIPAPYWISYPEMVKLAGGIPRFLQTNIDTKFKIQAHHLKNAMTSQVKVLLLNSPHNPTGQVYTENELKALAEVLMHYPNVWIISDEIYDRMVWDEALFCSFLNVAPELRDRTVTVNSLSKSAAMAGWRVGWAVTADASLIQTLIMLQGQSTSGINVLSQWGALEALKLSEAVFQEAMRDLYHRRSIVDRELKKLNQLKYLNPPGAFYFWLDVASYLKADENIIQFSESLLKIARVAVVPGLPFGCPNSIRLSFSIDETSLLEGCLRLVEFLKNRSF